MLPAEAPETPETLRGMRSLENSPLNIASVRAVRGVLGRGGGHLFLRDSASERTKPAPSQSLSSHRSVSVLEIVASPFSTAS